MGSQCFRFRTRYRRRTFQLADNTFSLTVLTGLFIVRSVTYAQTAYVYNSLRLRFVKQLPSTIWPNRKPKPNLSNQPFEQSDVCEGFGKPFSVERFVCTVCLVDTCHVIIYISCGHSCLRVWEGGSLLILPWTISVPPYSVSHPNCPLRGGYEKTVQLESISQT